MASFVGMCGRISSHNSFKEDIMDIREGNCIGELKKIAIESVQTIYLDPPFNSNHNYVLEVGSDIGFADKWTDEAYEAFIESVITECTRCLAKDGSLFFHISADQMFIPQTVLRKHFKFVRPIFWKRCRSKNNVKKTLGSAIDVLFWCYHSEKRKFAMVFQPRDQYYVEHSFKNKDDRGNYSFGHLVPDRTRTGHVYPFTINGRTFAPERGWRFPLNELQALADDNRLHVPTGKKANLYKKIYLNEGEGKPCMDLWDDIASIAQGTEERKYPTAKPVKLLERIIAMTTSEGDTVLDPMAGSGTTGEACRNLKRKAILIDLNPQAIAIMQERLISVIQRITVL